MAKHFYEVLETVYKTLRMPSDRNTPIAIDQYSCKLQFSHKPFDDVTGSKALLVQKKRIIRNNTGRRSCCQMTCKKKKKITFPPKLLRSKPGEVEHSEILKQNAFDQKNRKMSFKCEMIKSEIKKSLDDKDIIRLERKELVKDMKVPWIKGLSYTERNSVNHLVVKSHDFSQTPTFVRRSFSKKIL